MPAIEKWDGCVMIRWVLFFLTGWMGKIRPGSCQRPFSNGGLPDCLPLHRQKCEQTPGGIADKSERPHHGVAKCQRDGNHPV